MDTNVCLDLFVFRDLRWLTLLAALKNREIEAVTREDCRMEWRIVLNYKRLPLDPIARASSSAEFDALIPCLDLTPRDRGLLPACRDRDDQKFLELALDAEAGILITKDKDLLRLARRTARAGLFMIIQPDAWQPGLALE